MPSPPGNSPHTLRFVHTADLHLGSRVMSLPGMDEEDTTALANATYGAWRNIVDLCIGEEVDFLLVAGDTYDGADRNIRAQLQFIEGLRRLDENSIAAYVVRGNHDPDDAWSESIAMPENTTIFSSSEPEVVIHRDPDGRPLAAIVGMSFATVHIYDNLAEQFPGQEDEWPFTIGLLHCSVGGTVGHEPYAPCSIQDLRRCGYDYWALGHIHRPTILSAGNPQIIYAGTAGARYGETGERGCRLVTVDADGTVEVEAVRTCRHLWTEIEIDLSGSVDPAALEEDPEETRSYIREEVPVAGRILLTGATALHRELTVKGGIAALENSSKTRRVINTRSPSNGSYAGQSPSSTAMRSSPVTISSARSAGRPIWRYPAIKVACGKRYSPSTSRLWPGHTRANRTMRSSARSSVKPRACSSPTSREEKNEDPIALHRRIREIP